MKNAMNMGFVSLLVVSAVGCGQKLAFQGVPESPIAQSAPQPTEPVCQPGQTTITKPTKVIMVVDQSGSNKNGPYEHPGQATDPNKLLRYGAIAEVLLLNSGKKHVQWSLITFNDSAAHALTNAGSDQIPSFTDALGMGAALLTFKNSDDDGPTPYLAALEMVRSLIAADQGSVAPDTQYRIAFLTDGYPTDLPTGADAESAIADAIKSITSLAPQSVQLSTVYYGLPDSTATDRLQKMSVQGKGQFLNATNAKAIHLDDLLQVPKTTCN